MNPRRLMGIPLAEELHLTTSLNERRVLAILIFRPESTPPWIGRPHVTMLTLNRLPRRQGAEIHRVVEHQPVDFLCRHARLDMFDEHIKAVRDQLPGFAHAFERGGAVDFDLAGLAEGGNGGVDVGHGR